MSPPFIQLLSLGFIWVFLHCSPMCGPIISGFQLGSTKNLLLYQFGRSLTYGLAGFFAGLFGSHLQFKTTSLGWVIVAFLALMTFFSFSPKSISMKTPKWLFHLLGPLLQENQNSFRPIFLGILLGFLPCMLSLWALGLAASTESALQGMALMLLLVVMTTLPLYASSKLSRWLNQITHGQLTPYLLLISTLWASLVTLASMGVISHLHLSLPLFENRYTLMFW